MGTVNLKNTASKPIPVGEVDFSLMSDLPPRFDMNPLQRSNRVNIRLRTEDISTLENLALAAGMPFQAFLSTVIHQYANKKTR